MNENTRSPSLSENLNLEKEWPFLQQFAPESRAATNTNVFFKTSHSTGSVGKCVMKQSELMHIVPLIVRDHGLCGQHKGEHALSAYCHCPPIMQIFAK